MPVVVYAPHKDGHHDGSLAKQIHAFIRKLYEDDTLPGLHIEPIKGAVDRKVRTGRVNDNYRAILFKLIDDAGVPHYVYTGVWPHDEANRIAERSVLRVNPVNGLAELLIASQTELPAEQAPAADRPATALQPPDAFAAAPAAEPEPLLAGLTAEELTERLGIDPALAARALTVTTDDEMMALAERAVSWQGLALLDLAAGEAVDEVRAKLDLDQPPAVAADASVDEKLLAGFRTRTGQMQFAWLEDDEALRQAIEGSDFAAWRIFLHPEQRKYAETTYRGAFRLTGGAGTGKTVVLVHRARTLAQRTPEARLLLTTFTRTLADALRDSLRLLDPTVAIASAIGERGVAVSGIDAAALFVVRTADPDQVSIAVEQVLGISGFRFNATPSSGRARWREAIDTVGATLPPELRSPAFLEAEYDAVVLARRVRSRDDYLRVRRTGRGVALGRAQRAAVWEAIAAYRAAAAVSGTLDFSEVAAVAAAIAGDRPGGFVDHVLVDEGQDLSPAHWQLLRALVPEGPDDLFIAEDAHQQIYGQRVVLGRHGIRIVGRSRRLSLNYRTTQQVLGFATTVLDGGDYSDLDDDAVDGTGYRSVRRGRVPEMVATSTLEEEIGQVARVLEEWIAAGVAPETIGILARDQQLLSIIADSLGDHGQEVRVIDRGTAPGKRRPLLMTMHRAKGMEFRCVAIVGANRDLLPASYLLDSVPEGERAELLQRERSLFYVAATRARDELVVLWEGEPSKFLPARGRGTERPAAG